MASVNSPVAFNVKIVRLSSVCYRTLVFVRRRARSRVTVENCGSRTFEFDALETVLVRDAQNVAFTSRNAGVGDPFVSVAAYRFTERRFDVVVNVFTNIAGIFVAYCARGAQKRRPKQIWPLAQSQFRLSFAREAVRAAVEIPIIQKRILHFSRIRRCAVNLKINTTLI